MHPLKPIITTHNVQEKIKALDALTDACLDVERGEVEGLTPGYPSALRLVHPRNLVKRDLTTQEGLAALVHAIAHIEYNAIHIALDATYRFNSMPSAYYKDWLKVAKEEAYHFSMLREFLNKLGYEYGDFPAHNGLWKMCESTEHDVLARMALVPRVLEARGLDVSPVIQKKIKGINKAKGLDEILQIILRDEIGHVEIGNRWFHFLCKSRKLKPLPTFVSLVEKHLKGSIKGPFNTEARLKAGFTKEEMDFLSSA